MNDSHHSLAASPTPTSLGAMTQIGLLAGPFMSMIDSSIVNVALPNIAQHLHSSLASAQWIASGYLLSLGLSLAGTAFLSKRFGTKTVYIASMIGFTLTSALCAPATSIVWLIIARVLQGIFGAPLVPLAMNMLLGKGKARQQMSAAAGVLLFLAPAIGPTLGGVLIHWASWQAIFLINVPIGALAVIGAWNLPPTLTDRANKEAHFDAIGFMLLAFGLIGVTYGTTRGASGGWLHANSLPFWSIGLVLLVTYGVWGLRHANPILDLTLVRRRRQAFSLTLIALVSIITFSVVILIPTFMQEVEAKSAISAGLALLPQGLLMGIGVLLGEQLALRWGVQRTVFLGTVLLTAGSAGLLVISTTSSTWFLSLILCGRGFAVGFVVQPLLTGLINSLPRAKEADGNALFNVIERMSGTVGIALITTFFEAREHTHIARVIREVHLSPQTASSITSATARSLSTSVRLDLANAATAGFHDVVWLLTGASMLGIVLTCWTSGRWRREGEMESMDEAVS